MNKIEPDFDERLDDLQFENLMLFQKKDSYCFSNDAIYLCNFVKAKQSDTIVDLCSGSGVVGILAQAKTHAKKAILVEKQQKFAKMSQKSVDFNNLSSKIEVLNCDIKDCLDVLGVEKYDVVCSNPPYFLPQGKFLTGKKEIDISKFEIEMTFDDLCRVASRLLKFAGTFYFVNDSSRVAELCLTLKKHNLEPKRIEFIFSKSKKHSNVVLFECSKKGKPGAKVFYRNIGE